MWRSAIVVLIVAQAPDAPGLVGESSITKWFCATPRPPRRRATAPSEAPLNEPTVLTVKIDGDSALALSGETLTRIAGLFLDAVRVWLWACEACRYGRLPFVRVNDVVFVNPLFAEAIRVADRETTWINVRMLPRPSTGEPSTPKRQEPSWLTTDLFDPFDNTIRFSNLLPRITPALRERRSARRLTDDFPRYQPVNARELASHLCGLPRERLPAVIQALFDDMRCGGRSNGLPEGRALTILIHNGNTSCGYSKNIIACEADPYLIEFNARDYRFDDEQGERLLGTGARHVSLQHVLIHELGHWAGLPHVPSTRNVMSEFFEESDCVDNDVLDRLAEPSPPWTGLHNAPFYFSRD
jgi:Matrixin